MPSSNATCAYCGTRKPKRLQNQNLARRIGHVIVTAQHQRHAHQRVIDGVGEKERGAAIGATNDEVADVIGVEALLAMHEIVERDDLALRHAETQRRRLAFHQTFGALFRRQRRGRCPHSAAADPRPAAVCERCSARRACRSRDRSGRRHPAATAILRRWRGAAAGDRPHADRRYPAPRPNRCPASADRQTGRAMKSSLRARLVGILDAQDESPADLAGGQEVQQRGAGVARGAGSRSGWAQSV